jgi:hypothetical protein
MNYQIASDSSSADTMLKCCGCHIYLKLQNRIRRKMFSLAGPENAGLSLFINDKHLDLLAKRNVLFYGRPIEESGFICNSCRLAFINSRRQIRQRSLVRVQLL